MSISVGITPIALGGLAGVSTSNNVPASGLGNTRVLQVWGPAGTSVSLWAYNASAAQPWGLVVEAVVPASQSYAAIPLLPDASATYAASVPGTSATGVAVAVSGDPDPGGGSGTLAAGNAIDPAQLAAGTVAVAYVSPTTIPVQTTTNATPRTLVSVTIPSGSTAEAWGKITGKITAGMAGTPLWYTVEINARFASTGAAITEANSTTLPAIADQTATAATMVGSHDMTDAALYGGGGTLNGSTLVVTAANGQLNGKTSQTGTIAHTFGPTETDSQADFFIALGTVYSTLISAAVNGANYLVLTTVATGAPVQLSAAGTAATACGLGAAVRGGSAVGGFQPAISGNTIALDVVGGAGLTCAWAIDLDVRTSML